jgi:hypothetical protein
MTIISYRIKHIKTVLLGWSFWFMAMSFVLLLGCSGNTNNEDDHSKIIAQVGEVKLTEKVLLKVFSNKFDLKAESVRNYVRIWTEKEVVILSAKKELTDKEKDFSKALKDYENSLLKYSFEQKLLDSALSFEVSIDAINKYFNENKKNFELKENIVRVRYVKVPKKHKKLNRFKYMIQYKDSIQKEKFFQLTQKENIFCVADDSVWMKLDELKTLVPVKLYNDEHFLRHYKYTEAPEDDDIWIVYFSENRLKEGVAPIEMVKDKIKTIIVNQRKLELIQKREKQLYEAAKQSGVLQINLD